MGTDPAKTKDAEAAVMKQGSDRRPAPFTLAEERVLSGVRFPAGSVIGLDEEGRLWRCRLGATADVQGFPCAADEVSFFPAGTIASCRLARDFRLSGCLCRAGELVLFHPSGALFRAILAEDTAKDDFRFLAAEEICLHDNGRVASCTVREDVTVGAIRFRGGTRIWLDENGIPVAGVPVERRGNEGNAIRVFPATGS